MHCRSACLCSAGKLLNTKLSSSARVRRWRVWDPNVRRLGERPWARFIEGLREPLLKLAGLNGLAGEAGDSGEYTPPRLRRNLALSPLAQHVISTMLSLPLAQLTEAPMPPPPYPSPQPPARG